MSEARLTSLTIESPSPGRTIAVRVREGKSKSEKKSPGIVWLGGFMSDMKGTKAQALDSWAEEKGRACLRFDYSGHGESGGDFKQGTIGRWLEESLAVYARFAHGPQVVVGSSMGGWLALLLARELKMRSGAPPIAGMVLIAPAVDFTEELMWKNFSAAIKREMGRMQRNFSGIVDMAGLPTAMFVVDVNHEKIAVAEAKRAGIPCVGLVDTNSDPTTLSHPIPGNDDAVKSIRIIVEAIVAGVQSGLAQRDTRRAQRGAADIKAAAAPEVAVAEGEIDLSKIEIPADLADVVEGAEGETEVIAPKKKALRPKKPAVKAE